jgi:Carboxypeptidase regulatory-like domain
MRARWVGIGLVVCGVVVSGEWLVAGGREEVKAGKSVRVEEVGNSVKRQDAGIEERFLTPFGMTEFLLAEGVKETQDPPSRNEDGAPKKDVGGILGERQDAGIEERFLTPRTSFGVTEFVLEEGVRETQVFGTKCGLGDCGSEDPQSHVGRQEDGIEERFLPQKARKEAEVFASLGMTGLALGEGAPGANPKSTGRSACATGRMACTAERQEISGAAQGYKIAGVVVNAVTGAALGRVKVTLAETRARMQRIERVTDEGGRFEFAGMPAGKYSLQGSRGGYLTASYEQHEQYSTAIVTGPEFATEKLVLRLMPMAMIAGHVMDESGEPVRSARVQLFEETRLGGTSRVIGRGFSQSDDRGYFDLNGLEPGRYFVSVNARPWYAMHPGQVQGVEQHIPAALDVAYATTFYGGATESENAAPIELKGGEKKEIDIRMSPVPSLHLMIRMPETKVGPNQELTPQEIQRQVRMPVFQKRVFDTEEFVQFEGMQPVGPGVFEVSGIAAGRYDVSIHSGDPNEPQEFTEMNLTRDGQDLSATQGEILGKVKVTVKMPEGAPLPRPNAVGLRDARQRFAGVRPGDASGAAEFDGVKPGKYAILLLNPGKQYAVVKVVSGGEETAGHEVTVVGGTTAEVTAELVGGDTRIEGIVEKNGKPVAGAMVALVPKDPERHEE